MDTQSSTPSTKSRYVIAVEEPEVWQRIIKVEVPRAVFDREYARLLRSAVMEHVKPGFRKGRVPKTMVEKELGPNLRAEVLQRIVPEVFKGAIVEHELHPITDPDLRNLVFEPDKPITFDLVIEVRPKITARDYDNLPLRQRESAVSQSDVDQVLEGLRQNRGTYERVDRPAQAGDRLVLDLVPRQVDGQPDPQHKIENQHFHVGAEGNIAVFEEQLAGATAGLERPITVSYPGDHQSQALRGRTVTYDCQVRSVEQKLLPELGDAFAASITEGGTLLELRQAIRRDLEHEEQNHIRRELEEQIVDALLERNEIAVPPSLIEQYVRAGLEELHGHNAQAGRPNSEDEDRQYRQTTAQVAERILKGMFIMDAIRRQEGIQISDEEVDQRIQLIAQQNQLDPEKYREYVAKTSERDRILHALEERKTFDFLLSRAVIVQQTEKAAAD